VRQGTLGVMRVWAAYSPAMSFAGALGMGLVLWVGGRQVLADRMTVGELVASCSIWACSTNRSPRLHGLNQMLQAARAAGERVFDILDAPVERIQGAARADLPAPVRGEVRYETSASLPPERIVLRHISVTPGPVKWWPWPALREPANPPWSTLLPAFYQATSGRIND